MDRLTGVEILRFKDGDLLVDEQLLQAPDSMTADQVQQRGGSSQMNRLALLQGLARTKAELRYMADGGLENELMKPLRAPSAMAAAAQSAAQLAEKIAAADWSGDGAFETPALYRKEMSIDAWGAGAFNAKREAMTI